MKRRGLVSVLGVVLAGGQSRRMGGADKAELELAGQPLIAHAVARATPQVDDLIINVNHAPERFNHFLVPVVPDVLPDHAGPLAGILTAMIYAREFVPETLWIASFPTDAPFLPADLVDRMLVAVCDDNTRLACAVSAGRTHPVVGLWPVSLADELMSAMRDENMRKIDQWTARYPLSEVAWEGQPIDPFMNVNRPEDLAAAEKLLGAAADADD